MKEERTEFVGEEVNEVENKTKEKPKYELNWSHFFLFFFIFVGIGFTIGFLIGFFGSDNIVLLTEGYIGLILDAIIFFIALLLYRRINKFTLKSVDFSVLKRKKTYDYIFASLFIIAILQYVLLKIFGDESSLTQLNQLGYDGFETQWESLLFFLSIAIITPIKEEFLYRGIIHRFLDTRHNFWVGLIASSLIFGLAHVIGEVIIFATIMGVILVVLYRLTKSIVPGIILHMAWNFIAILPLLA